MDMQRAALLAAITLVSVMLLTEWVRFRDEHPPAPTAATVDTRTEMPSSQPASPAPSAGSTAELPAVTATPPAPVVAAPSRDVVSVKTDSLILDIALDGGDITSVALPRHLGKLNRPDLPFRLLESTEGRTYIAQSGLAGPNGTDTAAGRPHFSSSARNFTLKDGENSLVVDLAWNAPDGVSIIKRFTFHRGEYLVDVEYKVANRGSRMWEAALFGQLQRDNSPNPGATGGALGIQPFLGYATFTHDKPYKRFTLKDITEEKYEDTVLGGYIALVQHYFIGAWIPDPSQPNAYSIYQSNNGNFVGRFTGPTVRLTPGAETTIKAGFYAGPKDQYRLRQISPGLNLTVDYGWLWWIAQPLFALLTFFATGSLHIGDWSASLGAGIGNWGVSIILLTLVVKAAFFKLSATSYVSMAKMRKLQPKMLELRERYGDDRQKLSQETMDLYRREKVNPLGGCLPILIQMPVFLSLYWVLLESVELRHAPFFGWIEDLSVMDPFFVLPLLMGASMFFQQRLNPPPPDPMQAKIFQFMPIIFTVFFLFFPAGLVLYWLVNNVLSIAQQWVITNRIVKDI